MQNNAHDIYKMLLEVVAIPSITAEPEENSLPRFLKETLSTWPYFKENPQNLWLDPLQNDVHKRSNFCALVHAVPETKRTILLISHHDVVSVEMCAGVSASPFDPEKYTEALKSYVLPEKARADLDSGEWLFGRGVSDMKGGMAVQLGLLAEYAANPKKAPANILLMTLADEENNGFGVHQAARMLAQMQNDEKLDYIACIDSEPTITNEDKGNGHIYTGSIGNATLFAMCVGKNSHVGEYFQGVNATLISSCLISAIESDPESSDEWKGKHYSPYACLRTKNISEGYSVTLPERTAVLFNVLMVTKTPVQLMGYLTRKAKAALTEALNGLRIRREQMQASGYEGLPSVVYVPKIITYPELTAKVAEKYPKLLEKQQAFMDALPKELDTQDRAIALADYMLSLSEENGPFILIGLQSPYCQPRINKRGTAKEKAIITATEKIIALTKDKYNVTLVQDEVYEGISDMSEMGYQGTAEDINMLTSHLVGWGTDLRHPFDAMQKVDIPVINLGPIGKDAHKLTERVHKGFLLTILPDLLKALCEEISAQ